MIIKREFRDLKQAHDYHTAGIRFLLEKYEAVPTSILDWWDANCEQSQYDVLTKIGEPLSSADELIMATWARAPEYYTYYLQIHNVEVDIHWNMVVFDIADEYVALEFKLCVS